jgi:2-phospho-L-lactate transferase/gluconeogenesis factor (CofD/UPF0052 family)
MSGDAPHAVKVVLFSGGRGSGALLRQLLRHPAVDLTLAINGYDDGLSTGEVRRFLGDSLGPSDFRKSAAQIAAELRTCHPAIVTLLDLRLPDPCSISEAAEVLDLIRSPHGAAAAGAGMAPTVASLLSQCDGVARRGIAARIDAFEQERARTGRPFNFADCSLGNLVFAGSFLACERDFNRALGDYCDLLRLPPGIVENVTDGTNAFLVAVDVQDRLLASEEEIVDTRRQHRIKDIHLIDRPLDAAERERLATAGPAALSAFLEERAARVRLNPAVEQRTAAADVIIYAPGTQHSSLFPSYLTPGVSAAIAGNLTAVKLLVTNIQPDAEIAGSSAVDIIDRALYYLTDRGRLRIPNPCLITHYLINDPGIESGERYVPLGRLESLEDPRLVRISNYEEGVTGRHHAEKILKPFLDGLLARRQAKRIAVLLHDARSADKIAQTLIEMIRGGIAGVPVAVTVFYASDCAPERGFARSLPFAVRELPAGAAAAEAAFRGVLAAEPFDFVILFESSGMYRGEDVVGLASHLSFLHADAVWGSRRLSVREIQESYRLRYRHNIFLGTISYMGSHLLSLAYLMLHGRYVSDSLSGARAVRTDYLLSVNVPLSDKRVNHRLLTTVLGAGGDIFETPVQFFPLSPERVRRTSVLDGLRALGVILFARRSAPPVAPRPDAAPHDAQRPSPGAAAVSPAGEQVGVRKV